jgi:uncharacterized OsmC-like protein
LLSEVVVTKLKRLENYKFKAKFEDGNFPELLVDEPSPTGEGAGPRPTQLLSVAVGHCLSSSLLFCLKKARIAVEALDTTLKTEVSRNKVGRLEVKSIEAKIHLVVSDEDRERLPACLKVFENYCTVTQSVQRGIPVKVSFV